MSNVQGCLTCLGACRVAPACARSDTWQNARPTRGQPSDDRAHPRASGFARATGRGWGRPTAHHRRARARRLGARRRDRLSVPVRSLPVRSVRCRARRRRSPAGSGSTIRRSRSSGASATTFRRQSPTRSSPSLSGCSARASNGLLWTGALLALWAATGGTNALVKGIHRAYDVPEQRPFVLRYAIAIGLTLLAALASSARSSPSSAAR